MTNRHFLQGSATLLAAEKYLSLPPGMRDPQAFSDILHMILESGDQALAGSLFTDRRWLDEWLMPGQRYLSTAQQHMMSAFGEVMASRPEWRGTLLEGMSLLDAHSSMIHVHEALLRAAREFSRTSRGALAHDMWRLLGDSQCLYSTLDAGLIRGELSRRVVSPAGSYQLLDADEECQRLFFEIGYPYYAPRMRDWSRYCRFLERNPWAWEYMLTLRMSDALLVGMMDHLHSLPPSRRPSVAVDFVRRNRDGIRRRLGRRGYLLGSPADYACMSGEQISQMGMEELLRTGAVSFHLPDLNTFTCRVGVVASTHEGRARVLCTDADRLETRTILYEDIPAGAPVILWKDGVIRLRNIPQGLSDRLRSLSLECSGLEDGHRQERLRYPVFDYRDLVLGELLRLAGDDALPEIGANLPGLGRERLLEVMWRKSPAGYARQLFNELQCNGA